MNIKNFQKYKSDIYHQKRGNVVSIMRVGNQLFVGVNSGKTNPKFILHHPDGSTTSSSHAETSCLTGIPRSLNLSRARLYVVRFLASGEPGLSKPCRNCQKALKKVGIKPNRIYFTDREGQWQKLGKYELLD